MALPLDQTLSYYVIQAPLGAGGMGEVYRAMDTRLDREVAIKVLPSHFSQDQDRLRRFEREAKTLASLNHPNVAQVYGLDQADENSFIVMEYVDGEDLSQRLSQGPLPIGEAIEICRQIAEGLEAAHEAGVIHRDLKPANIRITNDEVVKVLDFGLAKPVGPGKNKVGISTSEPDSAMVTEEGLILGTPTYMSPEQARGKSIDRRTDIWSFGCVMYECLTGKRAFAGDNFSDLMVSILQTEPDWTALPSDLPPKVVRVLKRCLRRDKDKRTRHIGDACLDLDLSNDLDERETLESTTVLGSIGSRFSPLLVLGVGVQLITIVIISWFAGDAPADQTLAAAPPLQLSIPLPDGFEVLGAIEISRDGRRLAFAAIDPSGESYIYLRDLSKFGSEPVSGSRDGTNPFFSPDGQSIGFHARNNLWRVSTDGGNPTIVTNAKALVGASWNEDGTIVYSEGMMSPLWQVNAKGGASTALTNLDDDPLSYGHTWPEHIHGTDSLIFVSWVGGAGGGPRVLDLITGQAEHFAGSDIEGATRFAPTVRYVSSGYLIYENWKAGLLATPFDPSEREQVSLGTARQLLENVFHLGSETRSLFSISDNGTLAYVPGNPQKLQLVWVNATGERTLILSEEQISEFSSIGGRISISRDGKRALVGSYGDIVEVDLERSIPRRLTFDSANDSTPLWSFDQSQAIFSSNRDERWAIWALTLDGNSTPTLLLKKDVNLFAESVSPSGAISFLEMNAETGNDLWILEPGGEARELLVTESNESESSFSPDGQLIAYQSDRTGRDEIFVLPANGKGTPLQISNSGGTSPKWKASGDAIYFRRGRSLMQIEFADGRPSGVPEPIFEGPTLLHGSAYDFDQNNTRLLAVEVADEAIPNEIRVVTRFFNEIRRKTEPRAQN
ncbi:MAG: serine/threonine protein kinase [Planctomycetota bacterium]|jgi:serine/threonine protein kinase